MKLVTGRSLDAAIAERPTIEARLALLPHMIAVVDALAYAHSTGIIHRDLKPANVLVGEFGETVVIDWGLAKDLGDVNDRDANDVGPYRASAADLGATAAGSVMGTPAYMPAEQARGESVDSTADVYALGAMLYHLLAGAPPYAGATVEAILAAVVEGPPAAIETRVAGVPADLIAIVNKAMAHDRADRYQNAAALADDLKKFQTGQLVGVHRYSAWQLLGRWARRHRAAVVVAAVGLALLGAFGVISVQKIVVEREKTEEQRIRADDSRRRAEDLLSFMMVELRDKLKPVGKLELLDDIAKKAAAYYADRADSPTDSEDDRAKRSLALGNLGDVVLAQGNSAGAMEQYRRAHAIRESLAVANPRSDQRQADLAVSHTKLGEAFARQRNIAEALVHYRASLAIRTQLVARAPTPSHRRGLISSQRLIAQALLKGEGDVNGAITALRAAAAITEELGTERSDNTQRSAVAEELAEALLQSGDVSAAEASYRVSLKLVEAAVAADPLDAREQRALAQLRFKLAGVRELQHDVLVALEEHRASLAILDRLAVRDGTSSNLAYDRWRVNRAIGNLLHANGDIEQGLMHLTTSLDIIEQLGRKDPANLGWRADAATTRSNIGDALFAKGDHAGALAAQRESLAIFEAGPAGDLAFLRGRARVARKLATLQNK